MINPRVYFDLYKKRRLHWEKRAGGRRAVIAVPMSLVLGMKSWKMQPDLLCLQEELTGHTDGLDANWKGRNQE